MFVVAVLPFGWKHIDGERRTEWESEQHEVSREREGESGQYIQLHACSSRGGKTFANSIVYFFFFFNIYIFFLLLYLFRFCHCKLKYDVYIEKY